MRAAEALERLRSLPVRTFADLFGDRPLLVLAPHPDDESLACGGTIAEACACGHPVQVAILTDGSRSHPNSRAWPPARLAALRQSEARAAAVALGLPAAALHFLAQPDSAAPHDGPAFDAALQTLYSLMERHEIGTICASWIGDPHGDHGSAAKLAAAACAQIGARHMAYPVWAWTVPADADLPAVTTGARLDVSAHRAAKQRAIALHASQLGQVIGDDPAGFVMAPDFLALFAGRWEYFLDPG